MISELLTRICRVFYNLILRKKIGRIGNKFALMICLAGAVQPISAWATNSSACIAAARLASQHSGVPFAVLQAISLAETGRNSNGSFQPWPWTVNMEGKGNWFDTPDQALAYVNQHFQRGARSFDVGCFQLNYKWHGQAFSSVQQMFDPTANALYAAKFLQELYAEKGNWVDAAGAYHSRTPLYANSYKTRFQKLYARLSGNPQSELPNTAPPVPLQTVARTPEQPLAQLNNFPLLQSASPAMASLGSLMPESAGIGSLPLFGGS